jgi:hypothetical protein
MRLQLVYTKLAFVLRFATQNQVYFVCHSQDTVKISLNSIHRMGVTVTTDRILCQKGTEFLYVI